MSYKIPLFDLNFGKAEEEAVVETIRSKWISSGPKCLEFESLFSQSLNVGYALALSNCTVALHLALKILGIGKGDEVLLPSLTFVATANAVRYVDATPVFCDITSIEDLTIDPKEIERNITDKTKAIIVMHYAGFACDMDSIMNIAKKYGVKVIEDACHAPLSEYNGKKLGTIGDVGCFSFFSNKNISTGEGGMLVTNDKNLFETAKLLRSHGMTTMSYERSKGHSTVYDVIELGYNYRLDDIRASLGVIQLRNLYKDLEQREENRLIYVRELSTLTNIVVPFASNNCFVSNYIMPIVLKESNSEKRDSLRDFLHEKGIQTSVHYPAVHKFSIYEKYSKILTKTEYVVDNEVTLPMYASLTENQIKYICDSIKEFCDVNYDSM